MGGIIGDILSIAASAKAKKEAKKKNADLAAQYGVQQGYASDSSAQDDYLAQLAQSLGSQGSGYTDAFGGGTAYDPVSGTWKSTLNPQEQAVQGASYQEELARNTADQARRRTGLIDAERMRQQASGESDTALRDLGNFKAGVGRVDPQSLASTMRLNRTGAVNAGYDDAARAASTIGLRSGVSAGDALSTIARNRTKDIATTLGDPETEAMQLADQTNTTRQGNLGSLYNMFNGKANNVYDASFSPSTYDATATDNNLKAQTLDLNKYDTAGSLAGASATGYNATAAGLRAADTAKNGGTNYNINSQFLQGLGNSSNKISADLLKLFAAGG